MRELISYVAYILERRRLQKLRGQRARRVSLRPLKKLSEEESECLSCGANLVKSELYQQYRVCDVCRFHHSISALERIYLLADPDSFQKLDQTTADSELFHLIVMIPTKSV